MDPSFSSDSPYPPALAFVEREARCLRVWYGCKMEKGISPHSLGMSFYPNSKFVVLIMIIIIIIVFNDSNSFISYIYPQFFSNGL